MSNERPSIPGRKIEVNGVGYHVGEQGSGDKVVLLVHGMPDSSSAWHHQVPALVQAGYRVIAPDMLAYGETDKPQDVQRYRGEVIVGDMIALLGALGLEKGGFQPSSQQVRFEGIRLPVQPSQALAVCAKRSRGSTEWSLAHLLSRPTTRDLKASTRVSARNRSLLRGPAPPVPGLMLLEQTRCVLSKHERYEAGEATIHLVES